MVCVVSAVRLTCLRNMPDLTFIPEDSVLSRFSSSLNIVDGVAAMKIDSRMEVNSRQIHSSR